MNGCHRRASIGLRDGHLFSRAPFEPDATHGIVFLWIEEAHFKLIDEQVFQGAFDNLECVGIVCEIRQLRAEGFLGIDAKETSAPLGHRQAPPWQGK